MLSNTQQDYYLGNGRVAFFERNADGTTGKGVFAGNCPDFKITLTTEKKEHFESMSGKNLKDRDIVTQVGAEFSLTVESLDDANLALLVWGVKQSIAAAINQTYTIVAPAINALYRVPNGFNLSNVVLKDSGDDSLLVEGTHYEIDAAFGMIKVLSLATVAANIVVTYDRGAATAMPFFTGERPHRFGSFLGVNKGNGAQQKELWEIYDMVFDPVSDLSLIGDDFGKFELKGSCLVDVAREADANFGGFGRRLRA